MLRSIPASELRRGAVLALPMGRTATVQGDPKVGRKFVNFRTQYGASRVGLYDEVVLEEGCGCGTSTSTRS